MGSSFHFPYLSSDSSLGDLGRPSLNINGFTFQDISGVINSRQLSLFNRQYSILEARFRLSSQDECHPQPVQGRDRRPLDQESQRGGREEPYWNDRVQFEGGERLTFALEREDNRYKRELDGKSEPVDQGTVQHLIAISGNLVAAEEALRELFIRVEGLQARGGQ